MGGGGTMPTTNLSLNFLKLATAAVAEGKQIFIKYNQAS